MQSFLSCYKTKYHFFFSPLPHSSLSNKLEANGYRCLCPQKTCNQILLIYFGLQTMFS
ncbi:hypothetical protein Ahy_A06g027270 isoform B [Arachis hypogaea]|uniref:Uncharacterized protein n=1 Tax=Arachis hypogaea TaxID=3818 RepID=A0A445CN34_ARAHY|nr:hypothetical protein Ahy_A06g027270 isoform B [Arachis hypogaea]